MCNPTLIIGLAGIGMQAQGARMLSKSQAASMRANADVADVQAALDDERAKDAVARGQQSIFAKRLTQAQVRGRQKAVMAAKGLSLGEGSAFDILEDTDYLSDVDVNTIQTDAEREAWGYRERAKLGRFKAKQLRSGVPSTLMLGQVSAMGTAVSGVAKLDWSSVTGG